MFFREWREHRGLTLEQLADRLGTTKASVSRIERSNTNFTSQTLAAFAEALRCRPDQLLQLPTQLPMLSLQGLPADDAEKAFEYVRMLHLVRERDPGEAPAPEVVSPKPAAKGRTKKSA